ncbi:magnesium transporter CorA family protein [Clostridium sp. Marseille-P299]|uniref:magnesium transporter CorA family protein n=1 Tax=Clostridium sp. Marseille-P299 TaxID=1805477 RepID=UPI0008362A86|nr:CorA family divalent cation transporter [Clostridium sp. Marseille-P299]
MFYSIRDSKLVEVSLDNIQLNDIQSDNINIGYLTMDELKKCYKQLGISEYLITEGFADQTHFRNSIDVYDDFTFGYINIVNILDLREESDRIAFYITKNLFVLIEIVDRDGSTKEMFEKAIRRFTQKLTIEKIIYGILEGLVGGGSKALEQTEANILKMEHDLVEGNVDEDLNKSIFYLKNRLLIQKNYYEQLIDIGEELQENENDIFQEENLRFFKIFTDKVTRLSSNTQALCDGLIHLREAYDATLEYNLNRIMKVFTVVTTIFLPLTLIVGWYGMNFTTMPELTWKYGYISVILLSIFVVVACIIFFKKKKLF